MVSTKTPLLTSVNVVWREQQEALGFLPHVAALISVYLDSSDLWNIPQALDYGYLHLLQRLGATSRRLRPLSNRVCFLSAAQRGDISMLQWMAAYDPEFDGYGAVLDHAAEHGQLEVVKWLDKTIPDLQASTKAMDLASAHGHLEVYMKIGEKAALVMQWMKQGLEDMSKLCSGWQPIVMKDARSTQ